jgi:hypothetical protein
MWWPLGNTSVGAAPGVLGPGGPLEHFAVRWSHVTAKCGKNKWIERWRERL